MSHPFSGTAVVVSAAVLVVGVAAAAVAASQRGPLSVYADDSSYAIQGLAKSNGGNGVEGITEMANKAGVQGTGKRYGVLGLGSADGIGVQGEGRFGVQGKGLIGVVGVAVAGGSTSVGVRSVADNGSLEMQAVSTAGGVQQNVMSLDAAGNMILRGGLTQHGSPHLVVGSDRAAQRVAYGSESAAPAIEDTGEARISRGAGFVAIDSALGSALDARYGYTVLLTPEGDCRGLYVANKSPQGFVVRELMGGRSSIAFGYRIVGRPAAASGRRLPAYAEAR